MLKVIFEVLGLILASTALHGAATSFSVNLADRLRAATPGKWAALKRQSFVWLLVFLMLVVGFLEALLWAWYYFSRGHIADFAESTYFSLVTMTTLGYGDVTLKGVGRLISGAQAALGIVLFGWTTSLIFMAVQAVHVDRRHEGNTRAER
jgi:hypothetical protein